jgi:exonuclease III
MSRLDRVLLSQNWFGEWGNVSLWGLKRDVSDHCPLIVKYDDMIGAQNRLDSITFV